VIQADLALGLLDHLVAGSIAERDVFMLGLRNLIAAAPDTASKANAPTAVVPSLSAS
jgi:hypothetical protein